MKNITKKIMALLCAVMMLVMAVPCTVLADQVDSEASDMPFLAMGADLKESEEKTVYELLGVSEDELDQYQMIEITNEEEHAYLGEYVDASKIGTRALSSVLIEKQEEGHGIVVETNNISFCTQGMYCNALVTAGITDAKVIVAGPFSISGTAALVGVMKAYSSMTGEEISEEVMDTALNELVVTGDLAEETGDSEKMEELVAHLKQMVAEGKLNSDEDMEKAIKDASEQLDITLTQEQMDKLMALLDKLSKLDIDVDALQEQVKDIYDRVSDLEIDTEGIKNSLGDFFSGIIDAIAGFFKSIFG